jgi:penicillin-binding protein 1A
MVPPANVGGAPRDYRQYKGPYDSAVPVPPGDIGGGPMPPGDVGAARDNQGSRHERRQTTLFDILTGQ